VGKDELEVIRGGVDGDPQSVFGGFAMSNFHFSGPHANELRWHKIDREKGKKARPMDGLVVPSIDGEALGILKRLDDRCRVFVNPALERLHISSLDGERIFSPVRKGFLTQGPYNFVLDLWAPYTKQFGWHFVDSEVLYQLQRDLVLGWAIGSTSNSNTITYTGGGRVIANAVGQQSRVSAVILANSKAEQVGWQIRGAGAYSDSFPPFLDAVEAMINAGARAIFISYKTEKTEEKTMARLKSVADLCLANRVVLFAAPDEIVRGFFGH